MMQVVQRSRSPQTCEAESQRDGLSCGARSEVEPDEQPTNVRNETYFCIYDINLRVWFVVFVFIRQQKHSHFRLIEGWQQKSTTCRPKMSKR